MPRLAALAAMALLHAAALAAPPDPPPQADLEAGVVMAPWEGIPQPVGRDEEGLWQESDEAERLMANSARRLRDPALEAHVREVLCRTVGADRCGQVRIYLMRMPLFNAAMYPNGAMQVWTGALFRMASDDELAVVLAHEFAHFEKRHSLANFRNMRRGSDVMVWTAMLGIPLLPEIALAGLFSFSREQEREADRLSLAYLKQSDRNAGAAARLWERLIGEARATSVARGQKPDRLLRSGMFATHPAMPERAAYLRAQAPAEPEAEANSIAAYRAALSGAWTDVVLDQFGRNDFAGSAHVLDSLIAMSAHPDLLLAKAELYRRRGHPRDLELAIPLYRSVLSGEPARAEARRGLGLALARAGDRAQAACEMRRFLALRPDAPDAALYQKLIEEAVACDP